MLSWVLFRLPEWFYLHSFSSIYTSNLFFMIFKILKILFPSPLLPFSSLSNNSLLIQSHKLFQNLLPLFSTIPTPPFASFTPIFPLFFLAHPNVSKPYYFLSTSNAFHKLISEIYVIYFGNKLSILFDKLTVRITL